MKIAFDYQVFAMQRYGGISRYFVNLAQQLATLEQQVKIFAPVHYNLFAKEQVAELIEGKYITKFPPKTVRFFMAYDEMIARKKIRKWQPSIVHETYYRKKTSNLTSCPTVTTVHDMIYELFKDSFRPRDNTSALKRKSVDRAQHIICVSHNTKKDLMELFDVPESKVSVVHLGIDQQKPLVAQKVSVDKPYLLYVGHRGGYKNFIGLLKAYANSKRLRADFNIIAFGGGAFNHREKDSIRMLGLNEKQVIQREGNDELLNALYQKAAAFIYPSLYEGFGIPPLEAMLNECPVISSNVSSMPEVIDNAAAFFDPNSIEQIMQTIEKVIYDTDYSHQLINLGNERIKHFTWNKCAKETFSVYDDI